MEIGRTGSRPAVAGLLSQHAVLVSQFGGVDLPRRIDVVAVHVGKEDVERDALVTEGVVPAARKVGIRGADHLTVVVVDQVVVVHVAPLHVAGTDSLRILLGGHFAVVLVDAVHDEEVERADLLADLQRTVGADRDRLVVAQQFGELVAVGGDVELRQP